MGWSVCDGRMTSSTAISAASAASRTSEGCVTTACIHSCSGASATSDCGIRDLHVTERFRLLCLGMHSRKVGDVRIPLQQRGHVAGACAGASVQPPDLVDHEVILHV